MVVVVPALARRQPRQPPVVACGIRIGLAAEGVADGVDGRVQQQVSQRVKSRSGQAELTRLSAQEVQNTYGKALHALPAQPATFLLYFITGTDELTADSKLELDKVLGALRERPLPDVLVIGHTDTVGDAEANDRLSAQRAETVKGFLVGIGIAAERIRTAGRGERELLVPTDDNIEEPRNRRVEINVR